MKKTTLPSLLVLAGASFWGLIGLFTKNLASLGFTSMEITSVRLVGASLFMAVWFLISDASVFKIDIKDFWMFIGTGILSFVFFNWCYFNCIRLGSLSVAAVLLYTAPSFVIVMSAFLFKEKINAKKILSLILTTLGCVLVSGIGAKESISATAIVFGLGAGFGYALYSIFGRFALKKYSAAKVTFWTNLSGGLATLFLLDLSEFSVKIFDKTALFISVPLILFSTILPLLLYTKGLEKLDAGRASILATAEPVVASLISVFVFFEPLVFLQAVGIALVLTAVVLQS